MRNGEWRSWSLPAFAALYSAIRNPQSAIERALLKIHFQGKLQKVQLRFSLEIASAKRDSPKIRGKFLSCQDKYGMSGTNRLFLLHKMLDFLEGQKAFDPV